MSLVKLVNLILLISDQITAFLNKMKKAEIINAKNEALENGDQRVFEKAISSDHEEVVLVLPSGKYNGLYERAVKKKP